MTDRTEEGVVAKGVCGLCKSTVEDAEDMYCHGCRAVICDECGVNPDPPFGTHDKTIHTREPNY